MNCNCSYFVLYNYASFKCYYCCATIIFMIHIYVLCARISKLIVENSIFMNKQISKMHNFVCWGFTNIRKHIGFNAWFYCISVIPTAVKVVISYFKVDTTWTRRVIYSIVLWGWCRCFECNNWQFQNMWYSTQWVPLTKPNCIFRLPASKFWKSHFFLKPKLFTLKLGFTEWQESLN